MATTEKGIYYPNDGTQPADVLGDMKKMAESIDEAINDNTYDDTEIKEDISKIKEEQEKQNKNIEKNVTNITALQEENANLKAQIPSGTASGEEISLQDSAKMELADFSLEGNSKQVTREGYNLLYLNDNVSGEKNGITYNWNGNELVLNGTTTASFDIYNFGYWGSETQNEKRFLKAGTYTFKALGENNDKRYAINLYNGTKNVASLYQTNERIINLEEDTYYSNCYITIFSNKTFNNETIQFMLYEGTDDKAFEEYGVSPSLDYPSEVKTVGDNESVEVVKSNKNLFNIPDYNKTYNGVTVEITNGNHLKITGTATAGTTFNILRSDINGEVLQRLNALCIGKTITFQKNSTPKNLLEINLSTNSSLYFLQLFASTDSKSVQVNEKLTNLQILINANTEWNWETDLQFSISDKATDIVQPKENTYTLPIQKTMLNGDYIDLENKKEVHTYTKKVVSNTSEFNVNKNNNDKTFQFTVGITNPIQNAKVICNMFKFSPNTWNNTGCQISGNLFYGIVKFGDFGFTEDLTAEQAKQKFADILAETSLVFYYTLTVAEELDLTEEQTQVLEQIVKDGTCKEVTHFYTTEDLKPTIEVKYYKDLETLFKNQAEIQNALNNVQAQLLEIGGN